MITSIMIFGILTLFFMCCWAVTSSPKPGIESKLNKIFGILWCGSVFMIGLLALIQHIIL